VILPSAGLALSALLRNKMRSALTMLGVVIGVGAVVMMQSMGGGATAYVSELISGLGSNMLFVIPGSPQGFGRMTSGAPLFTLGGFSTGLLVCYDVEYPEAVRSLALLGAQLVLIPTALTDDYAAVPDFIVPARSIENQLYIAYCNHAGEENGMRFLGGSCLTGMDGRALAAAGSGEALIIGEISAHAREASARVYPYHNDRRPELYGLVTRAGR